MKKQSGKKMMLTKKEGHISFKSKSNGQMAQKLKQIMPAAVNSTYLIYSANGSINQWTPTTTSAPSMPVVDKEQPNNKVKRSYHSRHHRLTKRNSDNESISELEPLSISTWLSSMKPPITPLSPRSDGCPAVDIPPRKYFRTYSKQNSIPSSVLIPRTQLPNALAQEEPLVIPSQSDAVYPLWITRDTAINTSEEILPDISTPTATPCIQKSPVSTPDPPDSVSQKSTEEDRSFLFNSTNSSHSSEISRSSCRMVKLNINSPKQDENITSVVTHCSEQARVYKSKDALEKEDSNSDKKKTRVTIEIESGGECIIFLPVDRVEYRVVARGCRDCCSNKQNASKPTVTVETKQKDSI